MAVRGRLEGRDRPSGGLRGFARWLSTVLMMAGALLVADAIVTVTWQEPLSAYLAQRTQNGLSKDLDALDRTAPTHVERRALHALRDDRRRMRFLARKLQRDVQAGQAVGRIDIPKIGARFVVVDGVDPTSLTKGPGIYPQTHFPGAGGTTAIAGHRTTYLAPFRHVDALKPGDRIELEMPYGRFTYHVQTTKIVDPTDVGVIRNVGYDRLVLSACHPLYSAAQRIIVFARQVSAQPRGAARRTADPRTGAGSR